MFLPIDAQLPALVEALRAGRNVVLTAEPGAGKTTRTPRALLDAGLLARGECWVLEPRRLAARMAAARVAEELNEPLGQRVGYAVRFEQKVSKATRIRFVTEGLLLRRLQEDPRLRGIDVVMLDECHERHLQTDLALMLLRQLQQKHRPDLRLVAMSATLDAEAMVRHLDAVWLRSEGRLHPIEVRHLPRNEDRPLAIQVKEAVERHPTEGHTLVFLPGAAEIRAAERSLQDLAQQRGWRVMPLHGSLSFEAQRAAVAPSSVPKVLLSTNVAESSLTVEGVTTVIDSGLGREAAHSPWSGLPSLRTSRISRARCIQRTGRAGRLGPGLCVRLFTESDFKARPAFDAPEILRADLSDMVMLLHGLGLDETAALPWFEPPPGGALEAAERLLARLGALAGKRLTPLGKRMAALPLHPRLARLVTAADDLGIPRLGRRAAALLEVGDLSSRTTLARTQGPSHGLDSDLWARLDAYDEAEAAHFEPGALRAAGLDGAAIRQARLAVEAFSQGLPQGVSEPADAETRLLRALLAAYVDRLGKAGGTGTFTLVGGRGAKLGAESRLHRPDLIVALEAEEGAGETRIRMASKVETEWLLDVAPDQLRETTEVAFNPAKAAVERRDRLWFEDLCLEETRRPADASDPATAALLVEAALAGPPLTSLEGLLARLSFLRDQGFELPSETDLKTQLLTQACVGLRSLHELEAIPWAALFAEHYGRDALRRLETWAPETVMLKGRRTKVHYGEGPPWIASRLQDFLGLKEGPRIAGGAVPLVLHLLAPNQRAVQVTTDLAGFWQRAYRELRPSLSRRYPRHAWPEDPMGSGLSS